MIAVADLTGCPGGAAGSGEFRLLEGLEHPVQEDAGLLELLVPYLGPQCIGSGCLRRLDGAQGGAALGREPQELGAAVGGLSS